MALPKDDRIAALDERQGFQHKPLGHDEIRLLKVDLNDVSEQLSLTITNCRRSEVPAFEAISYTWGERPHKHKTISLNDHPFEVTQNAFWCLHFICKHYRRWAYLWMDSICIDQRNIPERNEQVSRMDWIYKTASLVLVWLGSDHDIEGDCWTMKTKTDDGDYSWRQSPYWWRIWVLQEVFLSQDLLLLYGPDISCLDVLRREWAQVRDGHSPQRHVPSDRKPERQYMNTYSMMRRRTTALSLQTASMLLQDHRCADARDRIFAILGLIWDVERLALSQYFPDYSMSIEKVHLIVIAHIVYWYGTRKHLTDLLESHFLPMNLHETFGPQYREAIVAIASAVLPLYRRLHHGRQGLGARLRFLVLEEEIGLDWEQSLHLLLDRTIADSTADTGATVTSREPQRYEALDFQSTLANEYCTLQGETRMLVDDLLSRLETAS